MIRAAYKLLKLQTYFTAGVKEVRAWTINIGDTAPKAAGVIHTDFEKGFIRAEVIAYEDYVTFGSEAKVKEAGKLRVEGKEYIVKDGDVMHFRFNAVIASLTGTDVAYTNAALTNLNNTQLTSANASISYLTGTHTAFQNSTIASLTGTNAYISYLTGVNASFTDLSAQTLNLGESLVVKNITGTNLNITGTASINNLTGARAHFTDITFDNFTGNYATVHVVS